jgi:hypothetical protein
MKNTLIILTLLASFSIRAQTWQWAKTINANTSPTGMCHDSNGNLFVVSTFSVGSSPTIIGSFTLSTPGMQYCIIKFDPNGNVTWVWSSSQLYIRKIAIDGADNLLFTGSFSGTVTINNNTITAAPTVGTLVFTGKFDPSGTLLWLKSGGGTTGSLAYDVTADANGNCYVAGRYGGNLATFGSFSLNAAPSVNNYFLVKYDASGNEQWLSGSQNGYFLHNDLATDMNGNVFVSGQVSSTVNIGTYTLNSTGGTYCLIKYNSVGQIQWHRTGAVATSLPYCVRTHTNGNVYISGVFTLNSMVVGTTTLTNNGGGDFFICGYDNNGNVLWARSGGSTGAENARNHALYSGGIYVAFAFSSATMSLGALTLSQPTTANTMAQDVMVLARYDYSGNVLSAKVYEGGDNSECGISIYNDCNLYMAGDLYSATATFSPFILSNPTYSPTNGGQALIVGKMNTEGVSSPTISVLGNTSVCQGNTISFSLTGASTYTASFLGSTTQTALSSNMFSFNPVSNSTFIVSGSIASLSCQGMTFMPIQINPTPSLNVAVKDYTICEGNSATFTVSGASTYTWGGGQTSNTLTVNPATTSTYIVAGSNTLGCVASKISTIVVSPCTEIVDNNLQLVLEWFPNPSSKEIFIRLKQADTYLILIMDITGQHQVKSERYESAEFVKLDVSDLKSGMYVLKIQNNQTEGVYKIIVDQ